IRDAGAEDEAASPSRETAGTSESQRGGNHSRRRIGNHRTPQGRMRDWSRDRLLRRAIQAGRTSLPLNLRRSAAVAARTGTSGHALAALTRTRRTDTVALAVRTRALAVGTRALAVRTVTLTVCTEALTVCAVAP